MISMDEIQQLREENKALRERVSILEEQVKKLLEQLGQNSRNSNWPSSWDKTRKKKPKTKSLRQKSNRKAGGQKGHKGHTLSFKAEPDEVVIHRPTHCLHCDEKLSDKTEAESVQKRQVLDLPPLEFITTEHQVETVTCAHCDQVTSGEFPEGITHPVQYGNQIKQLSVYLRSEQFVPYERCRQMMTDLFGLSISTGTLQNFFKLSAAKTEPIISQIKADLLQAPVAHADETGFYINKQRVWLHTMSTPELSYFEPHQNRGFKATEAIDILPKYQGVLVHDAWATYFKYDQMSHALCNVHHLRDLNGIIENDAQQWALLMKSALLAAKQLVDEAYLAGYDELAPEVTRRIGQLYTAIIEIGINENPWEKPPPHLKKRGRYKKSKARNLVERFERNQDAILRFAHNFKVPFDNNLAERDIRMMKVQQKISGCFRSWAGAKQFCQLRSYTSTLRKQGLNVWQALGALFEGDPVMPVTTPV